MTIGKTLEIVSEVGIVVEVVLNDCDEFGPWGKRLRRLHDQLVSLGKDLARMDGNAFLGEILALPDDVEVDAEFGLGEGA